MIGLSWNNVADAQSQTAEESLAISAPIRGAATKRMKVRTVINNDGTIVVIAEIPEIQLVPGPAISAKPGRYNGTWRADFRVVPKLSSTDTKQIRELANKLRAEALEKGESDGELSKEEFINSYTYFKNLADVASVDYAYNINRLRAIAVDDADRAEIDLFLHNLSKSFKTIDGKDCKELLIGALQPPADVFK